MAQKKVYEPLKDALVGNSKIESIETNTANPARYRIRNCKGVVNNATRYSTNTTLITFMSKDSEGKTVEGLQPEQLVLAIKDYLSKQENVNKDQIAALETFLNSSK